LEFVHVMRYSLRAGGLVINSIKKGKSFELHISHVLSNALGIEFRRVPMSGAFATNNVSSKDSRFKGDIFTENPQFNNEFFVVIETKITGVKLSIYDWVQGLKGKGLIGSWIEQCNRECSNRDWWLIFKYRGSKDFIIYNEYHLAREDGTMDSEVKVDLLETFLAGVKRVFRTDKEDE
jgi:hypothetical protein